MSELLVRKFHLYHLDKSHLSRTSSAMNPQERVVLVYENQFDTKEEALDYIREAKRADDFTILEVFSKSF